MSEHALQKKTNIPIHMTDLSIFDDAFSIMKEKFAAEMRRVDEEMTKFCNDLMTLYGQTATVGNVSSSHKDSPLNWEAITNSPLVEDDGDGKMLKLKFDVSQFHPDEVKVKVVNDLLTVSAIHEENTNDTIVFKEYNRKFLLPHGVDVEAVISSLSRDGILTIQAPLPEIALTEKPAENR